MSNEDSSRCRLDIRKLFTVWSDEALEEAAQTICGCSIPRSFQDQVGHAHEQLGPVKGVFANAAGGE